MYECEFVFICAWVFVVSVCACMRKWRRENIHFWIGSKTKSQSQSQLQHPESLSLSTLQNVPCAWQSKWKMETEKMSSSWARKWREISQGKCANLSFTYIQVVIFRLSYVRVYTAESCVLVRLYFTTSFGACMRAVFYRAPFKSTMLFHSHLPFIIFRALFINQHYIP